MDNTHFESKLNELGLSKKEFVSLVGMPYQTLMNWRAKGQTPVWVDSWLEFYTKAKAFDALQSILAPYVDKS